MTALYVVPAYGREYDTPEEAIADWKAEKDFKVARGGPYCSIRDLKLIKSEYSVIVACCGSFTCILE